MQKLKTMYMNALTYRIFLKKKYDWDLYWILINLYSKILKDLKGFYYKFIRL